MYSRAYGVSACTVEHMELGACTVEHNIMELVHVQLELGACTVEHTELVHVQ